MEAKIHYAKIPITEAVIDLRIIPLNKEMLPSLYSNFGDCIQTEYPNKMTVSEHKINIGQGSISTPTDLPIVGYRFSSHDEKQIVQTRLDGFSFSRLAPYQRWETFRDEARRLWDIYQTISSLETVIRVAVRYINRLDLPLPLNDFKEYLLTVPEISPEISQKLSAYFMQLQIPQEDIKAMLVLTEAIIPPSQPDPNVVSVLLDLDLFSDVKFSGNEDNHWTLLEKLRVRKNEIFEGSITDKTRELLK